MRKWERVNVTARCGGCGETLEHNTPVLTIALEGLRRKLKRCQKCVGPAPPDLPFNLQYKPQTPKPASLHQIAKSMTETWQPFKG